MRGTKRVQVQVVSRSLVEAFDHAMQEALRSLQDLDSTISIDSVDVTLTVNPLASSIPTIFMGVIKYSSRVGEE